MHLSKVTLVAAAIGLSGLVLAGPVKRQEGGDELTTTSTTTTPGDDGGSPPTTTTTTTPSSGGGGGGTTTTTTPGSGSSPSPDPRPEDECPPCTNYSFKFTPVPGGKTCSCLGNGDTAPWSWEPIKCIDDSTGLPNDEGRPSVCLGSGGNPNSRACLNGCNAMLTLANSGNPCNPNLFNAVRACTDCVPAGALRSNLNGRGSAPYINGADTMKRFTDAMSNWCAAPSRCIELSTGAKIRTGECAAVNPPTREDERQSGGGTTTPGGSGNGGRTTATTGRPGTATNPSISTQSTTLITVVAATDAGRSASPASSSLPSLSSIAGSTLPLSSPPPASIARSTLISTTDSNGRPTLSLAIETIANPEYTPNTVFGGGAASNTGAGNGAAGRSMVVDGGMVAFLASALVLRSLLF